MNVKWKMGLVNSPSSLWMRQPAHECEGQDSLTITNTAKPHNCKVQGLASPKLPHPNVLSMGVWDLFETPYKVHYHTQFDILNSIKSLKLLSEIILIKYGSIPSSIIIKLYPLAQNKFGRLRTKSRIPQPKINIS